MARKLSLPEHIQAKLPPGTLAALDAVRGEETRGELIRRIIEEWLTQKVAKKST